ncbi:hypothetical protein EDB89DRAFT_1913865 [Lactarius sanguifluus]|nr:hypothetical protein EDB89DRAFT_1913865 [Lactarius sanguifluus]
MDPTWHLNNSQQPIPANYPLPPPHAVAPHPGYLPHGVPYPPLTPGPTPPGPYLPTAHGYYGQQYQSFYAPYYAHPAPMPSPLHLASGVAGSVPVPMPMPTRQLPATPMCHPPATPARTPCGTGKRYVNSQCEPRVWEFDVSVASSEAKSIFKGHSAMSWDELQTEVLKRLRDTALPVQLGYKLSRDVGKVSYLSSEEEWEAALTHLDTKITMAWKNTTKPLSKVSKVLGSREKRRRQDDIPPPMTAEQWAVHQAFKELDIKLKCEAHKGHCFVDRSGGCDNHKRLDHRDLTVWAQQIASLDATIHAPPNLKLFDRPATKKPRHSHGTPEVHVAVNIAAPVSTTGTSVTSKTHRATSSCQRPMSMPNTAPPTAPADHIDPPVCMLLELMDIHDPSPTFSYVDKESDLADFGMKTVMQVYGMHQVLLATVGGLGKEGAGSLHAYVDKWLLPVIRPKGKGSTVGGRQEDVVAVEVEEVWGDRKGKGRILGRLLEEERHEAILVSSDEEGEQKRQEQAKDEDGPPIEVLKNEDDDDATTDTESFE